MSFDYVIVHVGVLGFLGSWDGEADFVPCHLGIKETKNRAVSSRDIYSCGRQGRGGCTAIPLDVNGKTLVGLTVFTNFVSNVDCPLQSVHDLRLLGIDIPQESVFHKDRRAYRVR